MSSEGASIDQQPKQGTMTRRTFLKAVGVGVAAAAVPDKQLQSLEQLADAVSSTSNSANDTTKKREDPEATPQKIESQKRTIPDEYIYNEREDDWWGEEDRGEKRYTCGPTAVASVVSTLLGREVTPTEIDAQFQQRGIRTAGDPEGTTFRTITTPGKENGVPELLREVYHLDVNQLYDTRSEDPHKQKVNFQAWKDAIGRGELIIASAGKAMFIDKDEEGNEPPEVGLLRFPRGADHIFIIEDIDIESKTMTIIDPMGGKRKKHIPFRDMQVPLYAYGVALPAAA